LREYRGCTSAPQHQSRNLSRRGTDGSRDPNRFVVAEVHGRPEQFDAWLDGSMGVDDIKPPIDDDYLRRRGSACEQLARSE